MITWIGESVLTTCDQLGNFGLFVIRVFQVALTRGCNISFLFYQMANIGVYTRNVVVLTGSTIGAVLATHGYEAFHMFGTEQFLGPLVYLAMTREFGAIISAIMLIGRAGSAMTAEIGSMSISEQIDALTTLSIDPIRYIVVPRVLATTLVMPLLSLFCVVFGVGAGYVISVFVFKVNAEMYVATIRTKLVLSDVYLGLIKAAVFGLLSALICTYKGIFARGGARGIGIATTESVVYSCVTVFFANYIMTALMFYE